MKVYRLKLYISSAFCTLVYLIFEIMLQDVDFVGYHVRRTTVAVCLHLLLPLIYTAGLGLVEPDWDMVCVSVCVCVCVCVCLFVMKNLLTSSIHGPFLFRSHSSGVLHLESLLLVSSWQHSGG